MISYFVRIVFWAAALCLPCYIGLAWAAGAETKPSIAAAIGDADTRALMDMWHGVWDNHEQIALQDASGIPEDGWHSRRKKVFASVDLPAFGPYVTYVEQYAGSPPSVVFRQRLYVHRYDLTTRQIITEIYAFSEGDAERVEGAHVNPHLLEGVKPEDMTVLPPGCAIYWRRLGDIFLGRQYAEQCSYIPPNTGFTEPILLSDTLTLTQEYLTTNTRLTDQKGTLIFGNAMGLEEIVKKAALFNCRVEPGEEGAYALSLYDEGGLAPVPSFGEEPGDMHLAFTRLMAPVSAFGDAALHLRLIDDKTGDIIAQAKTAYDANRIALTHGKTVIACTQSEDAVW